MIPLDPLSQPGSTEDLFLSQVLRCHDTGPRCESFLSLWQHIYLVGPCNLEIKILPFWFLVLFSGIPTSRCWILIIGLQYSHLLPLTFLMSPSLHFKPTFLEIFFQHHLPCVLLYSYITVIPYFKFPNALPCSLIFLFQKLLFLLWSEMSSFIFLRMAFSGVFV